MTETHRSTVPPQPRTLRSALSRFATGVAVVTAPGPTGPIGMTVNSFSAVSLDPPLVLFCVRHESALCPLFVQAETFCVNVLGAGQRHLSQQFASSRGADRFAAVDVRGGRTAAPVLAAAIAVFECRAEATVPAGDHEIVIGRVEAVQVGQADPLVFFGGSYRELEDLQPDPWAVLA
jgi:flavin reductase (DIM6/NTAB) family NADH-FMN oxidoreductase RutF